MQRPHCCIAMNICSIVIPPLPKASRIISAYEQRLANQSCDPVKMAGGIQGVLRDLKQSTHAPCEEDPREPQHRNRKPCSTVLLLLCDSAGEPIVQAVAGRIPYPPSLNPWGMYRIAGPTTPLIIPNTSCDCDIPGSRGEFCDRAS